MMVGFVKVESRVMKHQFGTLRDMEMDAGGEGKEPGPVWSRWKEGGMGNRGKPVWQYTEPDGARYLLSTLGRCVA